MSPSNRSYALALHSGAGPVPGRNYDTVEEHLRNLTMECEALLASGRSSLDVVESAVTEMENCV